MDHTENTASNNSSIVACLLDIEELCSPCHTSTHSTSLAFSCCVIVFTPNFMKMHHLVQSWLQETDTHDDITSHFSLEKHMLKHLNCS
jgi:hypothetical protein